MAIQLPNVGTGVPSDQTGDNEWLAMKKVRENFADQTNAASRLVGTASGNIRPVKLSTFSNLSDYLKTAIVSRTGDQVSLSNEQSMGYPKGLFVESGTDSGFLFFHSRFTVGDSKNSLRVILINDMTSEGASYKSGSVLMSGINTTADSNGFYKKSSPIVDLYDDRCELNNDAINQKSITFKKIGIGDYLVKGSLGFAQEGWYIEMPKDANGNVVVAVVYEQLANNDISVKTYAKKLDMETGDIIANVSVPRDIPDERFISLRLHELPKELPIMPAEEETEV